MYRMWLWGGLGVLCFFLACDASREEKKQSGKLNIVCTTGMIADLASAVAGERAQVVGLMGPGVDPHLYKASQGDIRKLHRADVIFYNGLHLEGKMQEILEKISREKPAVAVSDSIPRTRLLQPPEYEGNYDPHIWFDVSLWQEVLRPVVAVLSRVDPEGAPFYQENAQSYRARLDTLHTWVGEEIRKIPESQRVLVTAHDAFGYFGEAYGIEVVALQGISTVAEFGVNDVVRLVDLIVTRKIGAIFVESSVPERSINAVREGARARGFDVAIGGTLYSDAMGGPDSGANTYAGMVQANVRTIVNALR